MTKLFSKLHQWLKQSDAVLSMNRRNLHYVYPYNPRRYFQIADNKLLTKSHLAELDKGLAQTYLSFSYFYELNSLSEKLKALTSFVIKPAQGSGGNGIIVIKAKEGEHFISISGKRYTLKALKEHIANIIFGVFSLGMNDTAIIEERLTPHSKLLDLNHKGLSDIRIIYFKQKAILAMLRLATSASDGKANLHQGGIGVGIELKSGITRYAQIKRQNISHHPDNGAPLLERQLPDWEALLRLSKKAAQKIPLDYLGIDIALSAKGPIILEVNARPGIEIQNVNAQGMRPLLEGLK